MRQLHLTLILALSFAATSAFACVNAVRVSKDDEVAEVTLAERYMGERKYHEAIDRFLSLHTISLMSPRFDKMASSLRMARRMRRIAAIATIRVRGTKSLINFTRKEDDPAMIQTQLKWAHRQLRAAQARKPGDPQRKSQLAEADALMGKTDAARKTLEALAAQDLLSDAEAWALLARLRAEGGDTQGAKSAQSRCAAVAPDAQFCRPTI
jgi:tetratricopeptide (TPR) repeat protein